MTGSQPEPPRRCRTVSAIKSIVVQGKTSNDWYCCERHLGNPLVAGSSPARPANKTAAQMRFSSVRLTVGGSFGPEIPALYRRACGVSTKRPLAQQTHVKCEDSLVTASSE